MNYFKVKHTSDQRSASIRFKNNFLVGGELYTENEIRKAVEKGWTTNEFILTNFYKVEVPKKQTFWMFGVRKH